MYGSTPAAAQQTLWGRLDIASTPIDAEWCALDDESALLHQPGWLLGADAAFDEVHASTHWRAERRPMYDRIVDVPRLVSQARRHALPTEDRRRQIADLAGTALGTSFEHIGLNRYRDGHDSVAWHRDRLGRHRAWSMIALVSLGGPREFRVRSFVPPGTTAVGPRLSWSFTLASGDLLVMRGACQRDYEHTVPKTRTAAPRISLGLRTTEIVPDRRGSPIPAFGGATMGDQPRITMTHRGRTGGLK